MSASYHGLTIDNVGFAFEHMRDKVHHTHNVCQMNTSVRLMRAVLAYRKYYVNDKKDIAKWEKSRPMPDWYAEWMTIQNKTDEKMRR